MNIVEIEVTSPNYPLPADYNDLTEQGARQARVNATRQWLLPGTPEQVAERRVMSTWFFDRYYLHPDKEADFDPGFYDMAPLETPLLHWDLSRSWAINRLNVALAPRGSAKSTHMRKDMLLCMVTAPKYSFVYATSTHDNTKHTGQLMKDQCYSNSRIFDDFAPEYGGILKPARGDRPTGIEYFYLANGSFLRCVSAESRLRGLRPRRFRLDDPEYDEKMSTSMQAIRDYMERLLIKVALPMVMRANCGIDWVGTFVSKRHFLWHAMQTTPVEIDGVKVLKAQDPRFDYWTRMFFRAAYEDPETGKMRSVWPEMWPLDRAEKLAIGRPQAVSLEEMRELMGVAAFNGEMLGRPGTSEEQYFKLDPSPKGRHAWWIEDIDTLYATDPRASSTNFCFTHAGADVKMPLSDFLRDSKLFITVDTAYTEKASSDRRACCLMALYRDNLMFVLDLWSDIKPDSTLVNVTFKMADRWRAPLLAVEVVKESFKLYQRFKSAISTRMSTEIGNLFTPGLKDIRIGTMAKSDKIGALDLRFEHALIKFPLFMRFEKPWWRRLFDQVEGFNPEVEEGGLEKDDEIDTVAMSLFVIKGRMLKSALDKISDGSIDPIEELAAGRTTLPGGAAIAMGLPLQNLSDEDLGRIMRAGYAREIAANVGGRTKA